MKSGQRLPRAVGVIVLAACVSGAVWAASRPADRPDSMSTTIDYLDPDDTRPVSVEASCDLSIRHTLTYPLIVGQDGVVTLSWHSSGANPVPLAQLTMAGRRVRQQTLDGLSCLRWNVEPGTQYQLVLGLGPGRGVASVMWQEAATCA